MQISGGMLTRDPFEAALLAEQSQPDSPPATAEIAPKGKEVENEEDNEEGETETGIGDYIFSGGNPDGMTTIQEIISQFTDEQMNRYETFRRSGFKKSKMMKILAGILGTQKITDQMNITVSALAKMFIGDLIETARIVMTERNERGPIRPCHVREAYRRLKLEGKILRSSVPQLFR